MATQTRFNSQYDVLSARVREWDRWARTQQSIRWFARSLMPGLLIGITAAVISRLRPFLTPTQLAALSIGAVFGGLLIMLGMIWLRGRSPIQAAQRFDVQFGFQERVSTALELIEGRIHAYEELTDLQIEDAYNRTSNVDARTLIPIKMDRREWVTVLILTVALVLLIALPNPKADALSQNTAGQQTIATAEEEVRDAIQDIASNPNLDEATRDGLLESLEASLETLQDEEITEEEALATLGDVQEMLQNNAEGLREQSEQMRAAMEAAQESLSEMTNQGQSSDNSSDSSSGEGDSAGEDTSQSLQEMAQNLDEMTPEEQAALAEALQNAAEALQDTAPEAAQAMQDAADALQQGDTQTAQQKLQEAAEALQQAQQQQQQNSDAADNLEQSAQQMQQAQQQQQQQGEQGQQQQGQQGQQQQQQQGEQGQQQQGEQGQQQQSQDSQQSQQGQQGQPSEQGGDQPGEQGQSGQPQSGQQQPSSQQGQQGQQQQQQGSSDSQSNEGARDIGSSPGDNQGDTSGFEDSGDEPQGGGEAAGEGQFESVFAPRLPDEVGQDDIVLQPDASDQPLQEGDFSDNPEGQVTVPYNQVFSDYANSANEALDQDYIPLGLRDVVREYFTSLAPRSSDGGN